VTGKSNGVGLGLFVARQAAEAHGGWLEPVFAWNCRANCMRRWIVKPPSARAAKPNAACATRQPPGCSAAGRRARA
jgi:hypothetical protein